MVEEQQFIMSGDWYSQAEAMLDDHHVVAVSEDEATRIEFGSCVAIQTEQMMQVEVCPIFGRYVRGLEDLAYMMSRAFPAGGPVEPSVEGVMDCARRTRASTRRRFIIWHDADVFAAADRVIFWQVADALMGVAAEQEYASEDLLVITRCLFVGSPRLAEHVAFRRWWSEGEREPLWKVVSGLERPPVQCVRIVSEA